MEPESTEGKSFWKAWIFSNSSHAPKKGTKVNRFPWVNRMYLGEAILGQCRLTFFLCYYQNETRSFQAPNRHHV